MARTKQTKKTSGRANKKDRSNEEDNKSDAPPAKRAKTSTVGNRKEAPPNEKQEKPKETTESVQEQSTRPSGDESDVSLDEADVLKHLDHIGFRYKKAIGLMLNTRDKVDILRRAIEETKQRIRSNERKINKTKKEFEEEQEQFLKKMDEIQVSYNTSLQQYEAELQASKKKLDKEVQVLRDRKKQGSDFITKHKHKIHPSRLKDFSFFLDEADLIRYGVVPPHANTEAANENPGGVAIKTEAEEANATTEDVGGTKSATADDGATEPAADRDRDSSAARNEE